MKTLLLAISAISLIAGQEAPQLPQFLQQLPFFSQLQSLQEAFQHLQSSLPQEVMTQLQQSLPPVLANLLTGQTAAGRSLDLIPENIQTLIQQLQAGNFQQLVQQLQSGSLQQQLQQLASSLPPEVLQQIQQALPPLLASLLLPPTGRASVITAEELTEDQEKDISDFIRRCNGLFGGFNNYNTGNSGYGRYPYGYNTGFNNNQYPGYSQPFITVQNPYPYTYPNTGVIYGTNGQRVVTGRAAETRKGGKHGWWNKNPFNNFNKNPYYNYNNFNKNPYYNYNSNQKPFNNNIQNPYNNPYYNPSTNNPTYNPQYQYPDFTYGTIGTQGVAVPTTGNTNTGTITDIREGEQQE